MSQVPNASAASMTVAPGTSQTLSQLSVDMHVVAAGQTGALRVTSASSLMPGSQVVCLDCVTMTPRLLPMEVHAMPKQAIFEVNLKYLQTDGPGALRTETSATLLVPAGWQLLIEQIGKRSKKWCSPHKLKSGLSKVNVIVSNASDMAEMI